MKNDEITIDKQLVNFCYHLRSHHRTIFSAPFGEGKTYFLKRFQEEYSNDYTLIFLHPINYQVANNNDIFDLVKRDIFFQMIFNNIINPNYHIDDTVAKLFFLQNNITDVFGYFFSLLTSIGDFDKSLNWKFITSYGAYSIFMDLRRIFNEFKDKSFNDFIFEKFLKETDNIPCIQKDLITTIIKDCIVKYKRDNNKKIVLVIEDMDRLEPSHIFRILNVLSAQMDIPEIYNDETNISFNKYEFDNIVYVLDYNNIKSIYSKFYGEKTDFNGYISKISPQGYFLYSIKDKSQEYIYQKLIETTKLPSDIIKSYLPSDKLSKLDLRRILQSMIDVDSQIYKIEYWNVDKFEEYKPNSILKLFVILLRIGYLKEEIVISTKYIIQKNNNFINYFSLFFKEYSSMYNSGIFLLNENEELSKFTIIQQINDDILLKKVEGNIKKSGHKIFDNYDSIVSLFLQKISS